MFDFKNLAKLSKISNLAPEAMQKLDEMEAAALSEGAISKKNKELMAVAVALTTQCAYCIEYHRREAVKAGATEQELAETALVAAALKAGSAITHATHLFPEKQGA